MDSYEDLEDEWTRFAAELVSLQQRLRSVREALRAMRETVPVLEVTWE